MIYEQLLHILADDSRVQLGLIQDTTDGLLQSAGDSPLREALERRLRCAVHRPAAGLRLRVRATPRADRGARKGLARSRRTARFCQLFVFREP